MGIIWKIRQKQAIKELGEENYNKALAVVNEFLDEIQLGRGSDYSSYEDLIFESIKDSPRRNKIYGLLSSSLAMFTSAEIVDNIINETGMKFNEILLVALVGGGAILSLLKLIENSYETARSKEALVAYIRSKTDTNYPVDIDEVQTWDEFDEILFNWPEGAKIGGVFMSDKSANTIVTAACYDCINKSRNENNEMGER